MIIIKCIVSFSFCKTYNTVLNLFALLIVHMIDFFFFFFAVRTINVIALKQNESEILHGGGIHIWPDGDVPL